MRYLFRISLSALCCAALFFLSSCGKQNEKAFTINGCLPPEVDAEWIYMYYGLDDSTMVTDSVRIKDGTFVFKGIAPDALMVATLHPGSQDQYPAVAWSVLLEPGEITVDTMSQFAKGTPLNDGFSEWMEELYGIMMFGGDAVAVASSFNDHWEEHSSDAVGAIVLSCFAFAMDFQLVDSLASMMPEKVREEPIVKPFFEQLEARRSMQAGSKFTDVELTTLDGEAVRLSDYVGKGDYVLVDFWASWCGPCRQAMPELQSAVKKYKKLKVYGIAVNDETPNTLMAIENLNITWPVLCDPQALSAKTYGINAIPAMLLFSPDGTILARDFAVSGLDDVLSEHIK